MKIIGYLTLTPPDWDSLCRRSKQLLPLATEAVEMAIEKDEKTALIREIPCALGTLERSKCLAPAALERSKMRRRVRAKIS